MTEENKEKFELQTLEKMFVENKIDNLEDLVSQKMAEFQLNMTKIEIELTEEGYLKGI